MDSAKAEVNYRIKHFDISLLAFSEVKLKLSIIDQLEKVEFENS